MRLPDPLKHAVHSALSNVGIDDHHDQPENIEVSNTTLVVQPLPGGPGVWLITIPDEARVVKFSFRSIKEIAFGGKAGLIGVADSNQFRTTCGTIGGHGGLGVTTYNMIYSKAASALNLSDKVFSSAGDAVSLTECYIVPGSPTVLRTQWTNYGSGLKTLNVWGQIGVIG
jgi:hypothetical protein